MKAPRQLAVALAVAAVAAATASAAVAAPEQELALLLAPHAARAAPGTHSAALRTVAARRPITGERTTLPVLAHRLDADGIEWLNVLLPGRPNGHSGWIDARATTRASTPWRVVVDRAARRVIVFRDGRAVRAFSAVVGKPSTPTPPGTFFVEESVQLGPGDVGGPFALALSARSDVFQEFDGGPGQIALHGLANVGGVPGTAVSHGCVRLDDSAIRWLVQRIRPGVPVTVTR